MQSYKSGSHNKYLLLYHLILVCKYRKKLLMYMTIDNDVKKLSLEIAEKHDVRIHYMETDKDHIHYMIETSPNINLSNFVRTLKAYTTYHIWRNGVNAYYLSRHFCKEKTFWTDGYFISSIGNVSQETLRHYIEIQGK